MTVREIIYLVATTTAVFTLLITLACAFWREYEGWLHIVLAIITALLWGLFLWAALANTHWEGGAFLMLLVLWWAVTYQCWDRKRRS